jgi:alpha-glucosidase
MPDGGLPRRGTWPAHPVIYQIYPRSFADSTGSGEGDLRGVARRLGHVARLGADAVWIAPFYVSPMVDGGYDVADHTAVDPRFGTMEDWHALVAAARSLGLKVMVDLVLNHTSTEHGWFRDSAERRAGRDDWYVWADAAPGGSPPNNWLSFFGAPAWTWDHRRRQYYYHTFLPDQPKLNLRHPEVRRQVRQIVRFWCAAGADGFRLDAVTSYLHDESLADNPPAPPEVAARITGAPHNPYTWQDHVFDFLPGDGVPFMREVRDWAGPHSYLLGEVNSGNRSVELATDVSNAAGLDSAYVVDLAERGVTGTVIADMIARGACAEGLAWWLSSHDHPRHVSRAGDGSARDARLFAVLLCAMPGPLILYQGEEAGQRQAALPRAALHDPFDRVYWPDPPGREGARVPMPWGGAGFSPESPWLPVAADDAPAPLAAQEGRADSPLETYRAALAARKRRGLSEACLTVLEADESWFLGRLTDVAGEPVHLAVNLGHAPRRLPGAPLRAEMASAPALRGAEVAEVPPRTALWGSAGREGGAA